MGAERRFDRFLVLAVLLSVFAVAPLLAPGYFWSAHDARHSVYFLVEFDRSIRDGILYPRWSPDFTFGYGYPFFNIYSPGVFFLGEAFHLLGLEFVASVKAVFALGFILSALAMYLYAQRIFANHAAAVVASTVYVYAPYHLADVFLRGALADSFCFVFFPLVLLGFHDLVERPTTRAAVLAGAALAGLMFTHYALALLFLPFLAVYVLAVCIVLHRQNTRQALGPLAWAAAAGLFAAALAAILLLPAALEYRFVRTDQWAGGYYSYKDHFVYLFQFFAPTWSYGPGSVAGPHDTLPFQLGAVPAALSILSLLAIVRLRQERTQPLVVFHLLATVGLILLMLKAAMPVWELLRLAAFAQFPWRLLSLTTLTTAILSGSVLAAEEANSGKPPILAALLAVIVLGSYTYLQPQMGEPAEGPVSLGGLMRFQNSSGEMTGMTAWATSPKPPTWSPMADVYVAGDMVTDKVQRPLPPGVQATTIFHSTVREEVIVSASEPATITFYTAYYPGWRATIDGQPAEITPAGELGQVTVPVPAGEHTLVLEFTDTWPRRVGALLTALAILVGVFAVVRR